MAFSVLERTATEAIVEVRRSPSDVRVTRIGVDDRGTAFFEDHTGDSP